ncbi:hypothetical protein ASD21_07240 [Caulobacter sp. Root1455]|uniref:hypothetical protein n=1 Tax=unclassified Caulobacter TaxID=2648921 RepID=UPI0006F97043|nr:MULTISPECIES: hypothetical protein [unclassified Caulobacter]KQY30861.1 hypothetical protein ASD38_05720 [Caulobacter sp. Root487D2Y]KQY95152.1 hypothetical protein ASD21_07240 [Caulobacter sp. Root1455]
MGQSARHGWVIDDASAEAEGARSDAAFHATLDLLALMHDRPSQARRLPATARLPYENPATRAWREEQQRFQRVCGCATSAVSALIAMGLAATWSLTQGHDAPLLGLALRTLALTLAAGIVAGVAGKLAGLALGAARFRRATVRAIAELGRAAVGPL